MAIPVNGYLGDPARSTLEFQDGIDDMTAALNDGATGLDAKLNLAGGTLTGSLTSPLVTVRSLPTDSTGYFGTATTSVYINTTDVSGANDENAIVMNHNGETRINWDGFARVATSLDGATITGQATVTDAAPTAVSHLTRKDYVDDRVLNKNWVSRWTGSDTSVTNSWGTGSFLVKNSLGATFFIEVKSTSDTSAGGTKATITAGLDYIYGATLEGGAFKCWASEYGTSFISAFNANEIWKAE